MLLNETIGANIKCRKTVIPSEKYKKINILNALQSCQNFYEYKGKLLTIPDLERLVLGSTVYISKT